jgi:hypothetical protein
MITQRRRLASLEVIASGFVLCAAIVPTPLFLWLKLVLAALGAIGMYVGIATAYSLPSRETGAPGRTR